MSDFRQRLGHYGEQLAQAFIKAQGCTLLATNWREGRHGEIDIIALDLKLNRLRFIEVKTRRQVSFGHPIEAVTVTKQQTIRNLAQRYLDQHQQYQDKDVSFDVISVQVASQGPPNIEHLENVF